MIWFGIAIGVVPGSHDGTLSSGDVNTAKESPSGIPETASIRLARTTDGLARKYKASP
jgi:hypothetical protein